MTIYKCSQDKGSYQDNCKGDALPGMRYCQACCDKLDAEKAEILKNWKQPALINTGGFPVYNWY